MDKLSDDIQKTIRALENLSARPSNASDQLDELLDQLYQQKLDLAEPAPNPSSALYTHAARSMASAAERAERALREPTGLKGALTAVEEAIARLARLVDSAAHVP